jgi:hypothetical protein
MSDWESTIRTAVMVIGSIGSLVVLIWSKARENPAMLSDIKAIQSTFLIRNWLLLTVGSAGMVGMLSVAVVPLTPLSVLVCAIGAVFTAVCWAAIFALEISRISSKYFGLAHEAQAKAQHDFAQRLTGVLEPNAAEAQRATDKPD